MSYCVRAAEPANRVFKPSDLGSAAFRRDGSCCGRANKIKHARHNQEIHADPADEKLVSVCRIGYDNR